MHDDVALEEQFSTHLPLYSLRAAAGRFGEGHDVEVEGWIDVSDAAGLGKLDESTFVSQVVGRSMEPRIPSESFCVFRRIGPGTRQGKVVLAQHREISDPETGGSFTVKRYHSRKRTIDDEISGTIELQSLTTDLPDVSRVPRDAG